jgi:hypothetical protein
MAGHTEQLGSDGAPTPSDETLRLYLLCSLAADERLRIDERLLFDNEVAERIVLVESELTDDYAAGRLDTLEREAFAKKFLVTEDRRRQLRFTSVLQDHSRSQAAVSTSVPTALAEASWRERFAALLGPNRPVWALAGSFAVLILLVGVAWFIARQQRDSTSLIARHEAPTPVLSPPTPPPGSVPRAGVSPTPQPTPARKPAAVTSPAEPPVTIASFVLLPGAARSGGELARVAVPTGKRDVVRLSLTIEEATAAGDYQSELATAEGRTVFGPNKLRIEPGNRVVADIPARLLRSGDYQIKLTQRNADGQNETVARYYFRASKN